MSPKTITNKKYPMFAMCSLYPRDKRMNCACFLGKSHEIVEIMSKMHVDALFWAGLGSGVISLSNLEEEIHGKRNWDVKGRTEVEYLKDCANKGITVFATVFTGQAWEMGVETNKNETKFLSFGKFGGKGKKRWWGLQEFYENKYPKIFKGWGSYFKEKFVDENGVEIKDFIKEIASTDMHGRLLKSYWVDEPSKYFDTIVYNPCNNSALWRKYIKKIIEIQITAGAEGILFDENFDASYAYGGCFCKHCMKKFTKYLTKLHGKKFENFNYGQFLRNKGHGLISAVKYYFNEPYWREFRLFHLDSLIESLTEYIEHAKQFGKKKDEEIMTAGNFSLVWPVFFPLVDLVDVFNLEIENEIPPKNVRILYQLGRALIGSKPFSAVSSIMGASYLRDKEKKNPGSTGDIMKYFIAEAAASQGSYEIPYSCFTLTGIGSYYPSLESIYQYQDFLFRHQDCFEYLTLKPFSRINIICSWPSYFWTFNFLSMLGSHLLSLNGISNLLDDLFFSHSIAIFGDGRYIPSYINEPFKKEYLILPHIPCLSNKNIDDIKKFVINGGKVITCGDLGEFDVMYNKKKRKFIQELNDGWNSFEKGVIYKIPFDIGREYKSQNRDVDKKSFKKVLQKLAHKPFLETSSDDNFLFLPYINDQFIIIHILNKQYQKEPGKFTTLKEQTISIDAGFPVTNVYLLLPDGTETSLELQKEKEKSSFEVPKIELYAIIKMVRENP